MTRAIRSHREPRGSMFESLERRQYLSVAPLSADGSPAAREVVVPVRAPLSSLASLPPGAGVAGLKGTGAVVKSVGPARPAAAFGVYNATGYADEPDLAPVGVPRITLTADRFLRGGTGGAVDEAATRALARDAASAGTMLVLDVQDWALDQREAPGATVDANVANLRRVIGWLKDERPGLQVGLYGALPLADWSAAKNFNAYTAKAAKAATSGWATARLPAAKAARVAWEAANARLAPLAASIDFVAPSLDTYYVDPEGWNYFAAATLDEAAKYGKPVVPVINRDVRESSAHAGEEVPDAFWAQQREFVADRANGADGVILAGGAGRTWDPGAAWWRTTEAFARALQSPGGLSDGTDAGGFWVDNQTMFSNLEGLGDLGLDRRLNFTNGGVWKTYHGDVSTPDEEATRTLARQVAATGKILVLDIEHWPVDIRYSSRAEVDASLAKLMNIVDWLKDERPELKVGFYGILPLRDYWVPVNYQSRLKTTGWWRDTELAKWTPAQVAWEGADDYLKPLAEKVDYIVPSLYTFYDDPASWQLYAEGNLAEAARYGKPVIPVLQPFYHDSTPSGGTPVDGKFFAQQLDATRRLGAAGVAIWAGSYGAYNPADGWVAATAAFVGTLPKDVTAVGGTGLTGAAGTATGTATGTAAALVDSTSA